MSKCTPNEDSTLANTWCLIYSLEKCERTKINICGIANKVNLLKPLFNDQKYPTLTQ